MHLKYLGCEVLARMVYHCASLSPHIVDIELLERGLHENPANLRSILQQKIDQLDQEHYDAILLGYSLCGKATVGLTAGRHPLVIPRAHDCITLFLGDRRKYQSQFEQCPGTYWFVQDYIERTRENESYKGIGSFFDLDAEKKYNEYVEKYGKANADFLVETLGSWQKHYQRAVFIDHGLGSGESVENFAKKEAEKNHWSFEKLLANFSIIKRQINGEWENDFQFVKPGETLKMAFTDNVFGV